MPASLDDLAFARAIDEFAAATHGLIVPRPGQSHFNLNPVSAPYAETRAAPGFPQPPMLGPGAATAFNLDACFTIAPPLDLDGASA